MTQTASFGSRVRQSFRAWEKQPCACLKNWSPRIRTFHSDRSGPYETLWRMSINALIQR